MSDPGKAVFLSYASQDSEAARKICDALRAARVEVWFDQSELRGGDAWDANIRRQIKECALFVPIISVNTQIRPEGYFRLEWRLADQRTHLMGRTKAFVLPVCVDTTRDTDADVPDSFLAVQWTRLPGGATPPAFVERLKALLAGEAGPVSDRPHRRESAAAPIKRTPGWPKLTLALIVVGAAAGVAVVILPPWRKPENPAARVSPPIAEARQLVQQARTLLWGPNVSRADLETGEQLFEKAKALDPTDAEVWAIGALTDMRHFVLYFDRSDARKGQARTKAARALKLAPDSFEARLVQVCVLSSVVADASIRPEAERLIKSLLDEKPDDSRVLDAKGELLTVEGRDDEAAVYYRRANDPISEGWAYYHLGRMADAEAAADRGISSGRSVAGLLLKAHVKVYGREDLEAAQAAIDQLPASELLEEESAARAAGIRFFRGEPDKVLEILRAVPRDWIWYGGSEVPKAMFTGLAHHLANHPAAAQADWRAALRLIDERLATQSNNPPLIGYKAHLLALLGERDEAERNLRLYQQLQGQRDGQITVETAGIHVLLGRRDEIIDVLAAALKDPKAGLFLHADLRFSPVWDPLRGDPRFEALLRETLPKGAKPFDESKSEAGSQKPAARPLNIDRKSIAVLPFTNMSEDKEANAFFADGMHEDVITNLALIRELRVVSRTTAMQYRDTKKSLREVGAELGVAFVLEGSVQRLGQKVRVTGQLIDARTDQHVWAKSYDRDLTDIFAIQSELAQAIAAALQAAISPQVKALIERRPTENLAAYDLLLKARDVRNREDPFRVSLQKQETLLQSAVTLDPDFATAWAELVYACGLQYLNYFDHSDAMRTKATVARDNAVRLAPEAPEVIRGQGDYCFFVQHDYPRAIEHYEKFVGLQPNEPNGYRAIGSVQRWVGRWVEAVANYRKGTQLDPQDIQIPLNLAVLLGSGRRYDEALSEMRRVVALHPDAIFERYELALIPFEACGSTREMHDFFAGLPETLLNSVRLIGLRTDWAQMCGDFPEAIRLDRLQPYDSDDPADRAWEALEAAMTLAAQGEMTAARARLENNPEKIRARLELDPTNPFLWGVLGQMEALLGHSEEAVRCARKAVELMPESLNAWAGPACGEALANVYAWIGDKDRAFAEYSRLLRAAPGGTINHLNVHELKHGPWAFPLRDDPRFQTLLNDPKSNAPLF